METIKSDNELIAEFMGHKKDHRGLWPHPTGLTFDCSPNPLYDKSWDWLMPVVEKMFGLWQPASSGHQKSVNLKLDEFKRNTPIFCHIQQAHKNVVKFIKWYNQKSLTS